MTAQLLIDWQQEARMKDIENEWIKFHYVAAVKNSVTPSSVEENNL